MNTQVTPKTENLYRNFDLLRIDIDRMLLFGVIGAGIDTRILVDEFLADDPHTNMLLAWLEMQGTTNEQS